VCTASYAVHSHLCRFAPLDDYAKVIAHGAHTVSHMRTILPPSHALSSAIRALNSASQLPLVDKGPRTKDSLCSTLWKELSLRKSQHHRRIRSWKPVSRVDVRSLIDLSRSIAPASEHHRLVIPWSFANTMSLCQWCRKGPKVFFLL